MSQKHVTPGGAQPVDGTTAQGLLLCVIATLSVAASLLIAPVLPKIIAAFPEDPNVQTKVILTLTVPALVVALTSPFAGRLTEVCGRKIVLLWSLVLYVFCGLAPFFIGDLDMIIASRIGVGLAEAGFMTASTTLIGDYFHGARRETWLVVQTSTASISSVVLAIIGGAMGDMGWRWPFLIYATPVVLIPLLMFMIREPAKGGHEPAASGFPWLRLLPLYVVALFAAILFFIVPVQTAFVMSANGMTSSARIGLTTAMAGLAVGLGGLIFKRLNRHMTFLQTLLPAMALIAGGLWLFVSSGAYSRILVGSLIASVGCGIILPAVLTNIMSHLSFEQRGRGTGGWQTAFFLGNFASPVLVLALTGKFHSLAASLLLLSQACAITGGLCLIGVVVEKMFGRGKPAPVPAAKE